MEWSTPSKPTVWQPDTDVTSRLCRSRYSPSSSFSRAKNHITPNIKTRPPAKPAAAPHSPAVVPPIIPPTAAPTTVKIIGRRQPMICIADLSDRSHCSLFPVPQSIERRPRPDLWPLPFLVLSEPRKPAAGSAQSSGPSHLRGHGPYRGTEEIKAFSLCTRVLANDGESQRVWTAPAVEQAAEEQRLRIVSRNERLLGNETSGFVAVVQHAPEVVAILHSALSRHASPTANAARSRTAPAGAARARGPERPNAAAPAAPPATRASHRKTNDR